MNVPNDPNAQNDPNGPNGPRNEFVRRCDTIEEAYEFMLAYAAQGLTGDAGSASGGQLREFLRRAAAALNGMGDLLVTVIERQRLEPEARYREYAAVVDRDVSTLDESRLA